MEAGANGRRVLIVSWLREQRPPTTSASSEWTDPVWDALESLRAGRGQPWSRDYAAALPHLELQQLVLQERATWFRPRPPLDGRWGVLHRPKDGVDVFRSEVALNNGGPTVPVLTALRGLLAELNPSLVVSVGLGGGARAADQVGDVVVANTAKFALRGDLRTFAANGETFGSTAALEPDWFEGLEFKELQEPELLPPSPSFEKPGGAWPRPPSHTPTVRTVPEHPVVTQPATDANAFVPGSLDDEAAAVDMDAAALAKACAEAQIRFAAVLGLSVPALRPFKPDYDHSLRDAWAEVFNRDYAADAAQNAATVARRIVERVS